jgi:hypothetical protein
MVPNEEEIEEGQLVNNICVDNLHWVYYRHFSELNSPIVAAPITSNITINASLNASINKKLLPFSYKAIIAEVAADVDLATFQSFSNSGFVAGIGFKNSNI